MTVIIDGHAIFREAIGGIVEFVGVWKEGRTGQAVAVGV